MTSQNSLYKRILSLFSLILAVGAIAVLFNNCAEPASETKSDASILGAEFSGSISGNIIVVEASGLVQGYAYDPKNASKHMMVHFVVDGLENSGTYAGNIVANGAEAGTYSGHYYSFTLPAAFRNGQSRSLYAYGHEVKSAYRLTGSPKTFTAYVPKAEAVYTGSGLGGFISTSCAGCHNWNYSSLYYSTLISPSPFSTGTALNNKLINKISASHGGNGPFCATKSGFPCSAIQQWWTAEFQ